MNNNKLLKYIGWKCTELAINTIEYEFRPYKLLLFYDLEDYKSKIYLYKKIRCLVENDIIIKLMLN